MSTNYIEDEYTQVCLGMCYRPERVLTDIFALESAHASACDGIDLAEVGQQFYLEEISRTISVISMQCRQRVFSYLLNVKEQLGASIYVGLSDMERIAKIAELYPTSDEAIKSSCGFHVCGNDSIEELDFYRCIKTICHVEKWAYPVFFCKNGIDHEKLLTASGIEEGDDAIVQMLRVEVAKNDKQIGMGNIHDLLIDIPLFCSAARVLVTECEECNLIAVPNFSLSSELTC